MNIKNTIRHVFSRGLLMDKYIKRNELLLPNITEWQLTIGILAVFIFYRFMRLLIQTQNLHNIYIMSYSDMNFIVTAIMFVVIALLLLTQTQLSLPVYFVNVGLLLLLLFDMIASQISPLSFLGEILQFVVLLWTIGLVIYLYTKMRPNLTQQEYQIGWMFIGIYFFSLILKLSASLIISYTTLGEYLDFFSMVCMIVLIFSIVGYLILHSPYKNINLIVLVICLFFGIGFSFGMSTLDLTRLIAGSIFHESTSINTINILSPNLDILWIAGLACSFLSFIGIVAVGLIKKDLDKHVGILLILLGLTGLEIVAGAVLFARLYAFIALLEYYNEKH